jgi:uncharacterized protein (TIGR02588 family)
VTGGERDDDDRDDAANRHEPDATRWEHTSTAERVLFVIAATVILAVAGVLLVTGFSGPSEPPTFTVETHDVRPVDAVYHLPVTIKNVGDQTAVDVRVVARPSTTDTAAAAATQTIDFLVGGDEQTVTFVLAQDPRSTPVSVGVRAYAEP